MKNDQPTHGSFHSYLTGFVLSIVLTLIPLCLLWLHSYTHHSFPSHQLLAAAFIILAILQLFVQLIFFLHVGKGSSSHWNTVVLGLAIFIVVVIVGGTLWIMSNLQHTNLSDEFIGGVPSPQNQTN